jgi:hypothetical protein
MNHSQALIQKVESFQNLLVAIATGKTYEDSEYTSQRQQLLGEPIIAPLLPRFVHTCRDIKQFWSHIKGLFKTYQERREFLWGAFRPILEQLERGVTTPAERTAADILAVVDSPHVQDAWQSSFTRQETDPDGAITSARTLLETVCKFILDKAGGSYDEHMELPKLYKQAASKLNLAPDQHHDPIVKQILGGCQTVVEGLGAFRNKYGDAHGKGAAATLPSQRHASLAVNLAGTMAVFLINTYEEKGIKPGPIERGPTP